MLSSNFSGSNCGAEDDGSGSTTGSFNGVGGFVSAHWDGTTESELKIKEETSATIRCIPIDNKEEIGICILTGKPSKQRVLFAKAY